MGTYWVIMDINQQVIIEQEVFSTEWRWNTGYVAKAIVILDMVEIIRRKLYTIDNGGMHIAINNKKL